MSDVVVRYIPIRAFLGLFKSRTFSWIIRLVMVLSCFTCTPSPSAEMSWAELSFKWRRNGKSTNNHHKNAGSKKNKAVMGSYLWSGGEWRQNSFSAPAGTINSFPRAPFSTRAEGGAWKFVKNVAARTKKMWKQIAFLLSGVGPYWIWGIIKLRAFPLLNLLITASRLVVADGHHRSAHDGISLDFTNFNIFQRIF